MTELEHSAPLATLANMKAADANGYRGCVAYSHLTDEQYSATPGDYFMQSDDWTMTDSEGEPMHLVMFVTVIEDVRL